MESNGLVCVSFTCPKPGDAICSDHAATARIGHDCLSLAMADGFSDSLWGGDWAQTLCAGLSRAVKTSDYAYNPNLLRNLTLAQLPDLRGQHRPIPISDTEARRAAEGDFSTILLAAIKCESQRLYVSAAAMGNTCLFVREPDGALLSFPILDEKELNKPPKLVWSLSGLEASEASSLTMDSWPGLHPATLIIAATDELTRLIFLCKRYFALEDFLALLVGVVHGRIALHELFLMSIDKEPLTHADNLALCLCTSSFRCKDGGLQHSELRRAILEAQD